MEELVKRDGALPGPRAIHLLRQVGGALGEAHRVGLIHRDIKPSNVMVCDRGGIPDVAKLLDFGLVRAQVVGAADGSLTQEGAIPGTPAYMSPEQAAGREDLDGRSDIYSLGAVAYYLLTGRPPFAERSAVQMLAAHMYEAPAPLMTHRPDLPAALQEVVLRCLAKDPAERFADVGALIDELGACSPGRWRGVEAAAGGNEAGRCHRRRRQDAPGSEKGVETARRPPRRLIACRRAANRAGADGLHSELLVHLRAPISIDKGARRPLVGGHPTAREA